MHAWVCMYACVHMCTRVCVYIYILEDASRKPPAPHAFAWLKAYKISLSIDIIICRLRIGTIRSCGKSNREKLFRLCKMCKICNITFLSTWALSCNFSVDMASGWDCFVRQVGTPGPQSTQYNFIIAASSAHRGHKILITTPSQHLTNSR